MQIGMRVGAKSYGTKSYREPRPTVLDGTHQSVCRFLDPVSDVPPTTIATANAFSIVVRQCAVHYRAGQRREVNPSSYTGDKEGLKLSYNETILPWFGISTLV